MDCKISYNYKKKRASLWMKLWQQFRNHSNLLIRLSDLSRNRLRLQHVLTLLKTATMSYSINDNQKWMDVDVL